MTDPSSQEPALPPGYRLVDVLSRARGGFVARVEREGADLVLRMDGPQRGAEVLDELRVLSAVEHPGLIQVTDFGLDANGRPYVSRPWIEGTPLGEASATLSPSELDRVLVDLASALHHLHERGFLHGDLKSDNVLLSTSGRALLADYGLATSIGADSKDEKGVSGSFFHIAPELLHGAVAGPAADLFSFGVLLHELFAKTRPTASEFYGRFPSVAFLEAANSDAEVFPERYRGIAVRLLDSDPRRRPASAQELARELALRCGISFDGDSAAGEDLTRIPWGLGREGFARQFFESVENSGERQHFVVEDGRDGALVLAELQLESVLGRRDGFKFYDLDRELQSVAHAEGLDRWLAQCFEDLQSGAVVVSSSGESHWSRRAIQRIASFAGPGAFLSIGPSALSSSQEVIPVPGLGKRELLQHLKVSFAEGSPVDSYVDTLPLHSLHELKAALFADHQRGWILGLSPPYRLRDGWEKLGQRPDGEGNFATGSSRVESLASESLQVLLASVLSGGSLRLGLLHAAGFDQESIVSLCREGMAQIERGGSGLTLKLQGSVSRALNRALDGGGAILATPCPKLERTAMLQKDTYPEGSLLLRWCLERSSKNLEAWLAALERVRLCGAPERALDSAQLFTSLPEAIRGAESPSSVLREMALCWASLGEMDRSRALAEELAGSPLADRRAEALDIDGELATRRRDYAAVVSFEAAESLDPNRRERTLVARVRQAYAERNDDRLDTLMRTLQRVEGTTEREQFNARSLHAMSLVRRGKVDRARELLEGELKNSRKAGELFFEGGTRVNLGVLERRSGDLEKASRHFESAVELYQKAGVVEGLAQARALLGGVLRDLGFPRRAREILLRALGARERLNDREGAAAVRGMAGLCTADCGEIRAALDELIPAANELDRALRHDDALFLRTRASEIRARIGEEDSALPLFLRDPLAYEGDPRSLLSMARAAWHRGDSQSARLLARSAAGLASARSRTRDREESEWLLALLDAVSQTPARLRQDLSLSTPRLRQEFEVALHLSSDTSSFHPARAQALALDLEHRGRLDLAARLYLAMASHSSDAMLKTESRERAVELIEQAAAGLTETQRACFQARLLAFPDPDPISELEPIDDEEFDMDLTHFLEINRRLAGEEDLPSLLGTLVECALEISGARRGFLILEENGQLIFDTAFDSRRGDIEAPEVEISESVVRATLEEMRPLRLSNAAEDPELSSASSVQNLELRSVLCTPFDVGEGTRGVIYVDHALRAGQFGPRAEQLLGHLGVQAAIAIRQVHRLQSIQHLNERLSQQVDAVKSDLKRVQVKMQEVGVPDSELMGMIGSSEAMARARELLSKASQSDIPVLVLGASGTGKELAARAVHLGSPRSEGPWVSENCAALPESLIESELFGYRRGAFTGADQDRAGMFERAEGGTIFLDEIGELPLDLQAKLLRVLETGEVRRLGASESSQVDFRLVAATNRDLKAAAEAGEFRSDLLYRLDGLRVHMPTLSRRVDDIPELVEHFLELQNQKSGKVKRIADSVLRALCARSWPGNVRELANEVARLHLLSASDIVDPEMIRRPGSEDGSLVPTGTTLTLAQMERRTIEDALVRFGGDKQKTAQALDISRAKIYQRLAQWREEDEARDKSS